MVRSALRQVIGGRRVYEHSTGIIDCFKGCPRSIEIIGPFLSPPLGNILEDSLHGIGTVFWPRHNANVAL
jgi:hypothetical protein